MILVDVHTPKTFEEYLNSLSQGGEFRRSRIKRLFKKCKDIEFKNVPYDREEVKKFMNLWENQIIWGKKRKFSYGIEYPDKLAKNGLIECFAAYKDDETIGFNFNERHDDYLLLHPAMHNKTKYTDIGLSKFMWLNLIKWAIENTKIKWVDFGDSVDNWRESIKSRNLEKYKHIRYKWDYVSKWVKENPDKQPNLVLIIPEGKNIIEQKYGWKHSINKIKYLKMI